MGFFDFLYERRADMLDLGLQHLWLVAIAVALSATIGVALGTIA